MTLALELGGIQDYDVRRALENVAMLFPLQKQNVSNDVLVLNVAGTAHRIAFGNTLINAGASVNVAHGLGVTPQLVLATANRNDNTVCSFNTGTPDATNINLRNTSAVNSNVFWMAMG